VEILYYVFFSLLLVEIFLYVAFNGGETMKDFVLEQKQAVVSEIREKIENSGSLVLVDYRGLTVEQVTNLRNKYREAGVQYKVYKNTMMKLAFKELGLEDFNQYLEGPSAVAFSGEDLTAAARITNEFAKSNEKLVIKAGILEGKILDNNGVKAIANIPSREVLIAKLLGSLKAPVSNFVYMLDALRKKKEEEAA
jgi:ribosomal protein L10